MGGGDWLALTLPNYKRLLYYLDGSNFVSKMIEKIDINKNSFRFLHRLYELSGGFEYDKFNMIILGNELGLDKVSTEDVVKYLHEKGMIEIEGLGGKIVITSKGICELEGALLNPDKPTIYFPSVAEMFNYQPTIKAKKFIK